MSVVGPLTGTDHPTVVLIGLRPAENMEIADRAAKERWRTIFLSNTSQAETLFKDSSNINPAAILLDQDVDPGQTFNAISDLKRRDARVSVFVVGDSSTGRRSGFAVQTEAMKYLARPLTAEQVLHHVRVAVYGAASRTHEPKRQTENLSEPITFGALIGKSPIFRQAVELASHSAAGSEHVLIEGECGTGKHMLARAIHLASPRSLKPFESVQVERLSEVTLSSRLFGHVRGAFVGAFETQIGLLEQCAGATLLLDQVNRLPFPIQQRLGQALQARCARSIGGTQDYPVDVRIVALSSEALSDLVLKGVFDSRLFEMLGEIRIGLPPLRERGDDIELLAQHFLCSIPGPQGAGSVTLDEETISLLRRCKWPGNIPQLQETLLRAAVSSGNKVLRAEHFEYFDSLLAWSGKEAGHAKADAGCLVSFFTDQGHVRPLVEIEADVIRLAIELYEGRMSEVARRLGIGRSTLYRRLAQLEDTSIWNDDVASSQHP